MNRFVDAVGEQDLRRIESEKTRTYFSTGSRSG
jgi:hypothetical protein